MSVLADPEKQHTEMLFSTFNTMERKHGSLMMSSRIIINAEHQWWASRISPKVTGWTLIPLLLHVLSASPYSVTGPGSGQPWIGTVTFRVHMKQLIIWYNWWMWKQVCKRKEERVILMSPPSILGHFLLFIFYWSIIALQCWVSVCCTMKWISYIHIYIYIYIIYIYIFPPS